jgi:hypothetical protein
LVGSPEGVNGIAFATLFPLTFVASTFVPLSQMPGPLRAFAAWNPVTTLSDALRELFGNPNTPVEPGDPWSIAHPVAYTWIWVVAIIAVCAPLALLGKAKRRLSTPVVAIGGITLDNAPQLIAAGADGVAVISALFGADDVKLAARSFSALFSRRELEARAS